MKNSYYVGLDGSLRLVLANGMEVSLHTEPHLLAGTVNPTVSRRNVTLAIDNGLNLVEWRQRKEQARGQVTVYGRRLRVRAEGRRVQEFHPRVAVAIFLRCVRYGCAACRRSDDGDTRSGAVSPRVAVATVTLQSYGVPCLAVSALLRVKLKAHRGPKFALHF